VSEKSEGGWRTMTYAPTLPLPSYLVAFAAGPFDVVDGGRAGKKNTPIRFIVPKGKSEEAAYAKQTTGKILELLEDAIGIPYPYDKLDSVAVPLFFGAMENAGLITYDDGIMLGKAAQDSPQRQRTWVEIAAHEMAHQWFGDLVTMGWWNDLWLNESFATWMEYKIPQRFNPEWKYNLVQVNSQSDAMGADRQATAQPIRRAVETQDDIANAFDGITYTKGAATLQMFESYLGEAKFRQGVKNYLTRYSNGNARGEDFLEALRAMGGPGAAQAFGSFLDQAGVPVVKVTLDCATKPMLKLEQERSLPIGSKASSDRTWRIPMCVSYDAKGRVQRECKIVEGKTAAWPLTKAKGCPAWVNANPDHAGYYQALYAGDLLPKLLAEKGKRVNEAERMGTLNDVASLVNSGKVPIVEALSLVPDFKDDASRYTVGALIRILQGAEALRLPKESEAAFGRMVNAVFLERAKSLGWKPRVDDSQDTRLLRASLVPFVTNAGGDAGLAREARELAEAWLKDRTAVPAEIAGEALRAAALRGDAALFDRVLAAAEKEKDRRPRGAMLRALGAFRDPALARRALELTLEGKFDMREANSLLFGPGMYEPNRRLPIEFVKANYDALAAKMPRAVDSDMASFLVFTASTGCSAADRAEAEGFFGPRAEKWVGGKLALQEALESITLCEARNGQFAGPVAEFLKRY
jgi:alanyl aminopeptidase